MSTHHHILIVAEETPAFRWPHKSIPSVDICHLLGHGNSLQELVVVRLEDFMRDHGPELVFPHRHEFYQIVYFTEDSGSHTLDFQNHSASKGQMNVDQFRPLRIGNRLVAALRRQQLFRTIFQKTRGCYP